MGHDEITEIDRLKGQIEKMNADLLRLQDKIGYLEEEVRQAYKHGLEVGKSSIENREFDKQEQMRHEWQEEMRRDAFGDLWD